MVDVGEHRDRLLTIKRGEMPFAEADSWRKELQSDFESAFQTTKLPIVPTTSVPTHSSSTHAGERSRRHCHERRQHD